MDTFSDYADKSVSRHFFQQKIVVLRCQNCHLFKLIYIYNIIKITETVDLFKIERR